MPVSQRRASASFSIVARLTLLAPWPPPPAPNLPIPRPPSVLARPVACLAQSPEPPGQLPTPPPKPLHHPPAPPAHPMAPLDGRPHLPDASSQLAAQSSLPPSPPHSVSRPNTALQTHHPPRSIRPPPRLGCIVLSYAQTLPGPTPPSAVHICAGHPRTRPPPKDAQIARPRAAEPTLAAICKAPYTAARFRRTGSRPRRLANPVAAAPPLAPSCARQTHRVRG